jgi:hypothetical protein
MLKLRLDVDYQYPSRMKSFLYTALNRRPSKNYLRNSKIIARMINESPREISAYWFFTPYTAPDSELLELLYSDKHEVALHIATDPYAEMERLGRATQRKLRYYTVHGTARILARLMWRRKLWQAKIDVPSGFPLQPFYIFPTLGLDLVCYEKPRGEALRIAEGAIAKGEVLHFHPVWLFQRGIINHRGPVYETLKEILKVDKELERLVTRRKGFFKIASYKGALEYQRDFVPTESFLEKLRERGIDVFTFIERKWCCPNPTPPKSWVKTDDNIALLHITNYNYWLDIVGKKTRNMIRKADRSGIQIQIAQPSEQLAEGVWKIYNEIAVRQDRAFPHFGITLDAVRANVFSNTEEFFIAAYFQNELVGFIQIAFGNRIAIISQILSLIKHFDKAVNNALIAKAIEICADRGVAWLMYGRIGNHPSLDVFKQNNGFTKFSLPRYYVSVTRNGQLALRLGLHRDLKDVLPDGVKSVLIPMFNWVSRSKQKLII